MVGCAFYIRNFCGLTQFEFQWLEIALIGLEILDMAMDSKRGKICESKAPFGIAFQMELI